MCGPWHVASQPACIRYDCCWLNVFVTRGGHGSLPHSLPPRPQTAVANSAPYASGGSLWTTASRAVSQLISDLVYDADGDPVSVTRVGSPTYGTASFNATHITYQPDASKIPVTGAMDPVTYSVTDGFHPAVTAMVTVTISEPIWINILSDADACSWSRLEQRPCKRPTNNR